MLGDAPENVLGGLDLGQVHALLDDAAGGDHPALLVHVAMRQREQLPQDVVRVLRPHALQQGSQHRLHNASLSA